MCLLLKWHRLCQIHWIAGAPAAPVCEKSLKHLKNKRGIDFEAEVAVIVDDVSMEVSEEEAGQQIQLLMLFNDDSMRNLIPV